MCVCHPCGLRTAPPHTVKLASSLISAKWIFFNLFPHYSERKEGSQSSYSMKAFHFYFLQRARTHTHTDTFTVTNAFMCPSMRSEGKRGQLRIIKRYLFGSCRRRHSSCTWHFFPPQISSAVICRSTRDWFMFITMDKTFITTGWFQAFVQCETCWHIMSTTTHQQQ